MYIAEESLELHRGTLLWRHNGRDGVLNHQSHDSLLNRLFMRRSKKTSKLCVTGLCEGNSPVTGEFPAQTASNTENVSIWWRHHGNTLQTSNVSQPIMYAVDWWNMGNVFVLLPLKNAALIARFMGPTWGPSGADRTQVGPMLAPWTLLSGCGWVEHG